MKKVLAILVILAAAALVWMGLAKKTQVGRTAVTAGEDLNKELMTTEDDGGAADFVELQKSAEGL